MLSLLKTEQFNDIFNIMQDSFPLDEYRPYEEQKALLLRSEYSIYGLFDKELEQIKAFMAVYEFEEFIFIEHLAVKNGYRNQGLGATLIQELSNTTDKIICLEVEPPKTDIARRRIGFYERNGFVLNEYPYMQPTISKGKSPIELYIMSSKRGLTQKEFNEVEKVLYTKVYGQEV